MFLKKKSIKTPSPSRGEGRDGGGKTKTFLDVEKLVIEVLKDNKAENVKKIKLKDRTTIADEMIIATGRSSRHLQGLADKVSEALTRFYGDKPRVEGKATGWVIVDGIDIIVHLFTAEEREVYALENLWSK